MARKARAEVEGGLYHVITRGNNRRQIFNSLNGRDYATNMTYSPLGGMTEEKYGTDIPLYNKRHYNARGQMFDNRLSTVPWATDEWAWDRGAILNWYDANTSAFENRHNSGPDNNGNVRRSQSYTVLPGGGQAYYTDDYAYDSLNRLESINAYRDGAHQFIQAYIYDRYGNRTINAALPAAGINKKQFTVNTGNNRLGVGVGQTGTMTYDNAGNLSTDTYSGWGLNRAYDAENRMTQETQANNFVASYGYDGDGRRVKRTTAGTGQPSSVVETWQVYGLGGELLAEYAANAAPGTPQKEYGYRNGQLLITATTSAGGWGPAPSYTPPNPLASGGAIKLEHLTELRSAVNQLRGHAVLPDFNFTVDPNPQVNVTPLKAEHIRQLRAALEQAQSQLGLTIGGYAHPTLTENLSGIYAIDFQELRDQIQSAWNSSTGGVDIRWLVADHLGTPRMIFDQTGSLASVSRHDYLPFGEELFVGAGGRTLSEGYANTDAVRQKFTQKERDNETGLDYFGARYYGSPQGRFTSADEPFADQDEDDPQSWNLYQYAGNNPLLFTDPTGMWKWVDPDNNGNRFLQWEEGDDWKSLATFLNNNSDDTYRASDLEKAFGGGGLGAETIVDVTGAIPKFTNTRGLSDSSWELVPLGRGAKAAPGIFSRIARTLGFGAKSAVRIPGRQALPVLVRAVCFVAGTPILTREGLKPIEEIKAGDKVLSYNEQTRQTEYKTVIRTIVRFAEAENLLLVKVEGEVESLGLTDEHPFYVRIHRARDNTASENDDGEWREAGKLQVGDLIRKADGTWAKVENISRRSTGEAVYNFEVPDNHNYFVGKTSLLAHNNDACIETTLQTGRRTLTNRTVEALKLSKDEAKRAIEALKRDHGLRNDFHQMKIKSNGDVLNSNTGERIGNLYEYVP